MNAVRSPFFWLGMLTSAGALFLAFRGLHWSEVGEAFREADYLFLVPALAVMLFSLVVRAVRWAVLFHPLSGLRLTNLFGTMNVGYALSNVLPFRVGELARAYLVGEVEGVSKARALSTIAVERIADVLTVILILLFLLPFIDAPAWATGPALFLGLGVLILAAALAMLAMAHGRAMRVVERVSLVVPERWREDVRRVADSLIRGFAVLSKPGQLVRLQATSALAWVSSAAIMYLVMLAFNLGVPFTAALFVMVATSLGMVVPSSPGYVGVFHAIAIESLVNVFDVDRNAAASYALAQHAILYLVPIVIAAVYLWRERILWRRLITRPGWQVQTMEEVRATPAGGQPEGQSAQTHRPGG